MKNIVKILFILGVSGIALITSGFLESGFAQIKMESKSRIIIIKPSYRTSEFRNHDQCADDFLRNELGALLELEYLFNQMSVDGIDETFLSTNDNRDPDGNETLESTTGNSESTVSNEEYDLGIKAETALIYSETHIKDIADNDISVPLWCYQGETVSVVVSVANRNEYDESYLENFSETTSSAGTEDSLPLPAKETDNSIFDLDSLLNLWVTISF